MVHKTILNQNKKINKLMSKSPRVSKAYKYITQMVLNWSMSFQLDHPSPNQMKPQGYSLWLFCTHSPELLTPPHLTLFSDVCL